MNFSSALKVMLCHILELTPPAAFQLRNNMNLSLQQRCRCVVLGGGEQWLVEAEWPDGTINRLMLSRPISKL
jgi:hypothetical protein